MHITLMLFITSHSHDYIHYNNNIISLTYTSCMRFKNKASSTWNAINQIPKLNTLTHNQILKIQILFHLFETPKKEKPKTKKIYWCRLLQAKWMWIFFCVVQFFFFVLWENGGEGGINVYFSHSTVIQKKTRMGGWRGTWVGVFYSYCDWPWTLFCCHDWHPLYANGNDLGLSSFNINHRLRFQ